MQVQPLLPEGRRLYPREWFAPGVTLDLSDAPRSAGGARCWPCRRRDDRAPLVEGGQQTVAPSRRWAMAWSGIWRPGRVDLTNLGWRRKYAQGELLPPLLRSVPAGGVVVFDTFHQLSASAAWASRSPRCRIGSTARRPAGRRSLPCWRRLRVFLLLQGRRLGAAAGDMEQTRGARRRNMCRRWRTCIAQRAGLAAELARPSAQPAQARLARRRPLDPPICPMSTLSSAWPQLSRCCRRSRWPRWRRRCGAVRPIQRRAGAMAASEQQIVNTGGAHRSSCTPFDNYPGCA